MKSYRFIDGATQGYLVLVAALVLVWHGTAVPGWGWWFGSHLVCLSLIHGLIHLNAARPAHRGLDFLRQFYPALLYPFFYRETAALNQMFVSGYLDPMFQRLDERIFGFAPGLRFMAAFPSPALSELFYAAYFSYYLMILGVGLALFLRQRTAFQHYISVVSFVFYICYLIYIFLPVVGPRIYYPELAGFALPPDALPALVPPFPAAVQAGPFFRLMTVIYRNFEAPGAAFPSSHVAIALVTVYFSFRYLRPIRWAHLTVALVLCAATVYCRYHYAVDVAAGGLVAALLLPAGNGLYSRFGGTAASAGAVAQAVRS
jgi:membrane-associated phospholipid phosphatase